jgi:nitroreductase
VLCGSASQNGHMSVTEAIRGRRTNLRIDQTQEIAPSVMNGLLELATWAPNHHLTEPWRFAVVTGDGRAQLGQVTARFQADSGETNEAKLEKTRGKFLRAPAIVIVGCESAAGGRPDQQLEDRDACAAAVQNLLLAATEQGLNSYWGSGVVCSAPAVKDLCGFSVSTTIIAAIYLGYPLGEVPTPTRKAPIVTWVK